MINNYIKDEKGSILIITALGIVVLIGLLGLVIDTGRLYAEKIHLQSSLDSAVLASAFQHSKGDGEIINTFKDLAHKNQIPDDQTTFNFNVVNKSGNTTVYSSNVNNSDFKAILTISDQYILAELIRKKSLTFARVFNFNSTDVYVSSKVEFTPITSQKIKPIVVIWEDFSLNERLCLNHSPKGKKNNCNHSVNGNFGYLDFNNSKHFSENLSGLGVRYEVYDEVKTLPGAKVGQVRQGLQSLIQKDRQQGRTYCENFQLANDECARVIFLPLVKCLGNISDGECEEVTGKDSVVIEGFAAFWLEEINNNHALYGRFLHMIIPGGKKIPACEGKNSDCMIDAGVRVVRLVKPD